MASKAVPLVGGFYADDARPWSSQDVCEWIPVLAEQPNTLSPAMYRTPPGLRPFVAVDDAGPVRGARNVEGRLLVVMGNELFQISNTGVAIPRGTIPGVGLVQISHNQQGNSNQVIIVNGSAGYIYDTATLDVTRITDAGYPGAKSVDYLASYFLQVEPSGLFWFHSDLADGFAYNTLDRYESEAKPDRLVAVKSSQLEAVAFNQTTIEFFTNTGAATGTFQSKGIVIETGCASANGIVELDNSLMWLDNKGVFQRMEGYGARPISTRVLERAIADYDWSSAIAFVWEDRGHKVAYWTFRDGFTVGYDVTTGLWHRRASYGMNRWRLSCLVNWNGRWIGGDFQTGKLYELDWDYPYDGQDPMVRRAVTGALHNEQRRMSVPSIELVFDTGGPSVEVADFPAQPDFPVLTVGAPDGNVATAWGPYTYTATGGTPPYTFTKRTGDDFPAGIGPMSSAGVVAAGTPTTVETKSPMIRVTDGNGLYDQALDPITISLPVLGLEWQYTGIFGNNIFDVCFGTTSTDQDLFLACGSGIASDGEIWTSTDGDNWLQRTDGSSNAMRSCAFGYVGDDPLFVVSRDSANVLTSSDCVTWTNHATTDANAYTVTLYDGNAFIRAGLNNSAEYSSDAVTWTAQSRPSSNAATVGIAFEWGADKVAMVFCEAGAIHRTTDSGDNWTAITVPTDPAPAQNFTGAASDGVTVRAYKYASSILTTYTSVDGGVNWTWVQDNVGSSNYQAGPCLYRNGNWFGLGRTTTGGEQVQLWYSPDGLVPWTAAVVQDYDDTIAATMQALTASDMRAVLVGNKAAEGYAMTSPVLTP